MFIMNQNYNTCAAFVIDVLYTITYNMWQNYNRIQQHFLINGLKELDVSLEKTGNAKTACVMILYHGTEG